MSFTISAFARPHCVSAGQNHNSNLFRDQLLCQDDSAADILVVCDEAAAPSQRCVFFECLFRLQTFSDSGKSCSPPGGACSDGVTTA